MRGTITAVSWSSFTIQTGGRRMSVVSALTAAANAVTAGDYPYVYGGGHEAAGTASIGIKGGRATTAAGSALTARARSAPYWPAPACGRPAAASPPTTA